MSHSLNAPPAKEVPCSAAVRSGPIRYPIRHCTRDSPAGTLHGVVKHLTSSAAPRRISIILALALFPMLTFMGHWPASFALPGTTLRLRPACCAPNESNANTVTGNTATAIRPVVAMCPPPPGWASRSSRTDSSRRSVPGCCCCWRCAGGCHRQAWRSPPICDPRGSDFPVSWPVDRNAETQRRRDFLSPAGTGAPSNPAVEFANASLSESALSALLNVGCQRCPTFERKH